METLAGILLVIHLLSWAVVIGGALVSLREPKLPKGVTHAALSALVAGVLLVGVYEMGDIADINHIKVGVKLVIALVIAALAIYGARNQDKVTRGYLGALAGLTAVNVGIAVLWPGVA